MVNGKDESQVLYALNESHAAQLMKQAGFKTNARQVAASLNPLIKQAKYITRHSENCATITHGDTNWKILRIGGRHRKKHQKAPEHTTTRLVI